MHDLVCCWFQILAAFFIPIKQWLEVCVGAGRGAQFPCKNLSESILCDAWRPVDCYLKHHCSHRSTISTVIQTICALLRLAENNLFLFSHIFSFPLSLSLRLATHFSTNRPSALVFQAAGQLSAFKQTYKMSQEGRRRNPSPSRLIMSGLPHVTFYTTARTTIPYC